MTTKLSDRVRPNSEAAPWVIDEIKKLEAELAGDHCPHGVYWHACGDPKCAMHDDILDEEGYPTTHAFNLIENWDFHHTDKLFEFIRELWRWNDTHWVQKDDGEKIIYDISTGGWSGNEYLLSVLERNYAVWSMTWVQTRRGGHYIFELQYKEQPFLIGKKRDAI